MGEICSRCCDIALAFAMIVFPPFVAIPTGISVYFRNPRRRFVWMLNVPLIIAMYTLVSAAVFVGLDLIPKGGGLNVSLTIAISIATVLVVIFLYMMSNYLFELALQAEYERATQKRKPVVIQR